MSLYDLHVAFAWVVMISNGVAGVWALAAHRVEALQRREMWWFAAAAQISIAIQVTLGVLVMQVDEREAPSIHLFYGFVALASVGIIYSYRQQLEEWRFLLYGYGGLFLMGLAIRSFFLVGVV